MQMVQRRGDKTSSDGESAIQESDEDKKRIPMGNVSRLGGVVCFLALFVVVTSASGKTTRTESPKSAVGVRMKKENKITKEDDASLFLAEYLPFEKAFEKYDSCTVSFVPPPAKKTWDTKPLWLPSFPGSGCSNPAGKGDIFKPLINAIVSSLMVDRKPLNLARFVVFVAHFCCLLISSFVLSYRQG